MDWEISVCMQYLEYVLRQRKSYNLTVIWTFMLFLMLGNTDAVEAFSPKYRTIQGIILPVVWYMSGELP